MSQKMFQPVTVLMVYEPSPLTEKWAGSGVMAVVMVTFSSGMVNVCL